MLVHKGGQINIVQLITGIGSAVMSHIHFQCQNIQKNTSDILPKKKLIKKKKKKKIEPDDQWFCKRSPDIWAYCISTNKKFTKFDIVLKWVKVNSGT